jgi:hypothetical protein
VPWTDIPSANVTLLPYLGTGPLTLTSIKLLRYTVVSTDVMTLAFRIIVRFGGTGSLSGVILDLAIPYRGVFVATADSLGSNPPDSGLTFTNWCLIRPDRGGLGVVPGLVSLVNRKPSAGNMQIIIRHVGPNNIQPQGEMSLIGELTLQVAAKDARATRKTKR